MEYEGYLQANTRRQRTRQVLRGVAIKQSDGREKLTRPTVSKLPYKSDSINQSRYAQTVNRNFIAILSLYM